MSLCISYSVMGEMFLSHLNLPLTQSDQLSITGENDSSFAYHVLPCLQVFLPYQVDHEKFNTLPRRKKISMCCINTTLLSEETIRKNVVTLGQSSGLLHSSNPGAILT